MDLKQMPQVTNEAAREAFRMLAWIEAVPDGLEHLLDRDQAMYDLSEALDNALDSPERVYATGTAKDEEGRDGIVWDDEDGNSWLHVLGD